MKEECRNSLYSDECGITEPPFKRKRGRPRKSDPPVIKIVKKKKSFLFCDKCPRKFLKKHIFELHQQTHDPLPVTKPSKKGICPVCHFTFDHLANHMKVHGDSVILTTPRPYLCRFCSKPMRRRDELEEHERSHTKEKPFECNICGAKFASRKAWRGHASLHTGEKKYKCNLCDRRFRLKTNQYIHERTVHKTITYPCPNGCQKQFIYPGQLKKHIIVTGCSNASILDNSFAIKE